MNLALTATAPNLQDNLLESTKLYPLINNTVPPDTGPNSGLIEVNEASGMYPNCVPLVVKSFPLKVTSKLTNPSFSEAEEGGVVQRISVELITFIVALPDSPKLQLLEPKFSSENPAPVIVTTVPPTTLPLPGKIEYISTSSTNLYSAETPSKSNPLLLTEINTDVPAPPNVLVGEWQTISFWLMKVAGTLRKLLLVLLVGLCFVRGWQFLFWLTCYFRFQTCRPTPRQTQSLFRQLLPACFRWMDRMLAILS